jgi:hypothetical protein
VNRAVLDDHLLRDLLSDDVSNPLARVLGEHEPATSNLYYLRLCQSAVSARGGRLTGSWPIEPRRVLERTLLALPAAIEIVPMRALSFQMAELADQHRVSTLGAEAVAAAVHLQAPLCVWEDDDGAGIRAAANAAGAIYQTIPR